MVMGMGIGIGIRMGNRLLCRSRMVLGILFLWAFSVSICSFPLFDQGNHTAHSAIFSFVIWNTNKGFKSGFSCILKIYKHTPPIITNPKG